MINKEYYKKIKEALRELSSEAQYIGEEGGMTTECKTKIGAWRRFRKLVRETEGIGEETRIELKDIGIGFLHLAEETTQENRECMNDCEWYVDYKYISPFIVWVYNE